MYKYSRKLVSDWILTIATNIVAAGLGLAVTKLMASRIPPGDYGKASLTLGLIALMNNVIIGPSLSAHMRVRFDKDLDATANTQDIRISALIVCGTALVIYTFIALLQWYLDEPSYVILLPAALLVLGTQLYASLCSNDAEAARNYGALLWQTVIVKGAPLFAIPLLQFAFTNSSIVVLLALATGPLITVLLKPFVLPGSKTAPVWTVNSTFSISRLRDTQLWSRALWPMGLTLPLGYALHWLLSTGDRYVLGWYVPKEEVGVYVLNYGLWSMPFQILNGCLENLTRPVLYARAAAGDLRAVAQISILRTLVGAFISLAGILLAMVIGKDISRMLLGDAYWISSSFLLLITSAHLCMVVGYAVVPVFVAIKEPLPICLATAVGAIVCISYDCIKVPTGTLHAAAIGTLLGYIIWVSLLIIFAFSKLKGSTEPLGGISCNEVVSVFRSGFQRQKPVSVAK